MKTSRSELTKVLQNSLNALDLRVPAFDQQHIVQLVWNCMTQPHRVYHTPDHLTDLFLQDEPIANIAILFHDIVHFGVDQKFPTDVQHMIRREVVTHDQKMFLRAVPDEEDINLKVTREIFGMKSGDELNPKLGMNEFLSALVAMRSLERFMPLNLRVQIAVCIEGTIPFRPPHANGENSFDIVFQKLERLNKTLELEMSPQDCISAVECAVQVANSDISNFTFANPTLFLDHTWRNIAETNPSLTSSSDFKVTDYRAALLRMGHFFSSITADRILSRFRNYPEKEEYDRLMNLTEQNLDRAEHYLKGKVLSVAILEAIADCTGGDESLVHFVGRTENGVAVGPQLIDFLPPSPEMHPDAPNEILKLFECGRTGEVSFDIQRSPVAEFLCRRIGLKRMEKFASSAEQMWSKSISTREFLRRLDQGIVHDIVLAVSHVALDRKTALLKLIA